MLIQFALVLLAPGVQESESIPFADIAYRGEFVGEIDGNGSPEIIVASCNGETWKAELRSGEDHAVFREHAALVGDRVGSLGGDFDGDGVPDYWIECWPEEPPPLTVDWYLGCRPETEIREIWTRTARPISSSRTWWPKAAQVSSTFLA